VAAVEEEEVEEHSVVEVSRPVGEDIEVATEGVDEDLLHTRSQTWWNRRAYWKAYDR